MKIELNNYKLIRIIRNYNKIMRIKKINKI